MNIYVTTTMGTGYNDDRTLRNAQVFDCILLGIKVIKSVRFYSHASGVYSVSFYLKSITETLSEPAFVTYIL